MLFAITFAIGLSSAEAKEVPLSDSEVQYELQGESLALFLRRFFADQGLRLVISDKLQSDRRTLNGPRRGTPAEVLQSISDSNGLVSYFDGTSAYVYAEDEVSHRYLTIPADRGPALQTAITRMELSDYSNYTLVDSKTGLVEIIGVPRYVTQMQMLTEVVALQDEPVSTVFRYIPLKYAWASDRTFTVGSRQVTVPGVANILRQVVQGRSSEQGFDGVKDTMLPATAESMRGQGLAAQGDSRKQSRNADLKDEYMVDLYRLAQDNRASKRQDDANIVPQDEQGMTRIVADPYRNALIIRDVPQRIRLYEELIQTLDISTPIVEIEATIIDVNTDKLRDMGVEWRYGTNSLEVMSADGGTKLDFLGALAGDSVSLIDQVPGLQIGAIIGDKNRFITRISSLEQQGVLKIASRPKVATLNDLEAVIESSRSLYVPVEGAFEVDLFKVFAGTVLRVTPHVIHDGPQTRIRLIITVEDGTVDLSSSSAGKSEIPTATRNAVNTQAMIDVGHSLLLGGLVRDEEFSETRKIPFLGDIPLVGQLFRRDAKGSRRAERLFLISPRLVTPDGAYGTTGGQVNGAKSPMARYEKETLEWLNQTCKGNCSEEYGSQGLQMF